MKKQIEKIARNLSILLFIAMLLGCNFNEKKTDPTIYRAINGKDTAVISLSTAENRFWGQYEIRYSKMGKDSGDVRGEIIGDTLRGVYKYISYGGSWKKAPIALLKKNDKLILGKGVASSLMDMPIYMSDVPIDYNNSIFIFEEVKKSDKK